MKKLMSLDYFKSIMPQYKDEKFLPHYLGEQEALDFVNYYVRIFVPEYDSIHPYSQNIFVLGLLHSLNDKLQFYMDPCSYSNCLNLIPVCHWLVSIGNATIQLDYRFSNINPLDMFGENWRKVLGSKYIGEDAVPNTD